MDNHSFKYSLPTYEVTFCIGSREGYNGKSFTREDLLNQINKFQSDFPESMPVKVGNTVTFTMKDYREDGWEISAINYPNGKLKPPEIDKFMYALAEHLLYHFKQNRITIRHLFNHINRESEPTTVMLEMNDAEKSHHK